MTAPAADQIQQAVNALRQGGVIVMPSDTLYALSAVASDAKAVQRVFDIKGREGGRPLPLFVNSVEMAERIGVLDQQSRCLASRFWPGQLTLVVPRQPGFHSDALAGGDTVGLRVPRNDVALQIIEAVGDALTGTSANLTGGADPVTADEVRRQIGGRVDIILDTGPAQVGVGSTIVDCTGEDVRILRHGAIADEDVHQALKDCKENL